MEIGIASPNEKEKSMQMKQYEASAGPLAPREKGVGEQMGDMYKQKAMNAAVDESSKMAMEGAKPYMQGMTNAINPMGSAGAGAVAGQATTNAALANAGMTGGAEIALAGQTLAPSLAATGATTGVGTGLATGAGAGAGMAALGTAVPYIGAAMLADKALGLGIMDSLFSKGGKVGPLSPQYKAEGGETMSQEEAMALMNNQPAPMPMPQPRPINFPDPEELLQEMSMPQPRSRPESINPYDAAMNYEGYDPIQPAPTDLPQYRAGGGPLGMGILSMYQDMMKKNMR